MIKKRIHISYVHYVLLFSYVILENQTIKTLKLCQNREFISRIASISSKNECHVISH